MKNMRVLILAVLLAAISQAGYAYWQVIHPFNPATQDAVVANAAGRHNRTGATNAVEGFAGSLYYCVYADGSENPSKVYRYNPDTGVNTVIISSPADSFIALGAMKGDLYISHTDGNLYRTKGVGAESVTRYPFSDVNYVTAMAEFDNAMYFATSRGEIYRSATGQVFQQVAALGKSVQDIIVWKGAIYGCDSSSGGNSSMLFRSLNGRDWTIVGAYNVDRFHAFAGSTTRLYVCSTIDPAQPSMGIRHTVNGTYWGPIFGDLSQGDAVQGRAVWFPGDRKVYFPSIKDGVTRLFPCWGDEVAAGIPMARQYGSLAVVDGLLFAVGSQSDETFVGRLGVYVIAPTPQPTPTPLPTPTPTPPPTVDPRPDTDGDGKPDECETDTPGAVSTRLTNIILPDSDADGLLDGQEDPGDCAGITPLAMTNPRNADTDGDGILDGVEVLLLGSDPLNAASPGNVVDADNDGLPASIDPDDSTPDADGDGFTDAYEMLMGSDPLDYDSRPTLGDVDGNGSTNNVDAIRLFNFMLGNIAPPSNLGRADIRADGSINNVDAVVLFNWLLGNTPFIPVR